MARSVTGRLRADAARRGAGGGGLAARAQVRRVSNASPAGSRRGPAADPHRLYWTHKYSAIASAVSALRVRKGYFDGELCGVSPDGVTSFSFFGQTSASSRRSPIEILLQRSVDCALTRDRA